MKILPAVVLLLLGFVLSQSCFSQDSSMHNQPAPETLMQDTSVSLDPAFIVLNRYAIRDSIAAARAWAMKMRDTTITIDPSYEIFSPYAEEDSILAVAARKDSLIKAKRDALNAIGAALLRTADMQDTTIEIDAAFILRDRYAQRDSLDAIRDSARAILVRAAALQDTVIEIDPSFVIINRYAQKDKYEAFRDSVWTSLADAAKMQDTTIQIEPDFRVMDIYAVRDKQEAIRDSLARPGMMQDTVIVLDNSFIVQDLYPIKDSLDEARETIRAYTDSVYSDSVNRHWAGWKKYDLQPDHAYTLNAEKVLKNRSRANLQYNIADFYLYLNGVPVTPEKSVYDFFAAGCLAFKYDDTLLLNSGLGFKVGVGVGIKIIQGRFTSSLHANKHNEEIYKYEAEDTVYVKSIMLEPVSQSLKLPYDPSYVANEIVTGEYQATYKKFYQKNEDGQDEAQRYTVRIIFRCRVTGGFDSMKSLK